MPLRIQMPGTVRLDWAFFTALVLLGLQIASGTRLLFAELVFVFTLAAAIAVNLLGGLQIGRAHV